MPWMSRGPLGGACPYRLLICAAPLKAQAWLAPLWAAPACELGSWAAVMLLLLLLLGAGLEACPASGRCSGVREGGPAAAAALLLQPPHAGAHAPASIVCVPSGLPRLHLWHC